MLETITDILFYYDRPLIYVAKDKIGLTYFCYTYYDDTDMTCEWYIRISRKRYRALMNSSITFLQILRFPEYNIYDSVWLRQMGDKYFEIDIEKYKIDASMLPAAGLRRNRHYY